MADKQDVGIKVSQSGYSTTNAPDYALTFSSSWPQVPIIKEFTQTVPVTITVDPTNGGYRYYAAGPVFTHNLGFFAFAQFWIGYTEPLTGKLSIIKPVDSLGMFGSKLTNNTVIPLDYNGHFPTAIAGPSQVTWHVKVYNFDITIARSYPYKQPPIVPQPYDKDYGIKIVKQNKQITSNDMRDFILHSRCQSPQIDSINISDASKNVIYKNTTGYLNWVFGYFTNDGITYQELQPQGTNSSPNFFYGYGGDPNTYAIINVYGGANYASSIVVLRDPLFVAKNIEVTY